MKKILLMLIGLTFFLEANAMDDKLYCELTKIADTVIEKEYPRSYKERNEHEYVISNRDKYWRISWKVRPGIAEGSPVILIEKNTFKVIKHYHTQ